MTHFSLTLYYPSSHIDNTSFAPVYESERAVYSSDASKANMRTHTLWGKTFTDSNILLVSQLHLGKQLEFIGFMVHCENNRLSCEHACTHTCVYLCTNTPLWSGHHSSLHCHRHHTATFPDSCVGTRQQPRHRTQARGQGLFPLHRHTRPLALTSFLHVQ